ncbi:MAG: C-GCAxxG-C-C family protein [Candidatus Cryptobacteroides sp.]
MENIDASTRAAKAKEYFKNGYNCCQAVALAFKDIIGLDEKSIATLSSGFGGGFGRMREVCGAVSGMTMVAGALKPATDTSNKAAKAENYALVQEFAESYRKENGSIICRELLGLGGKGPESPVPSDRTPEYYKKRPCADLVECAARIVAEKMAEL